MSPEELDALAKKIARLAFRSVSVSQQGQSKPRSRAAEIAADFLRKLLPDPAKFFVGGIAYFHKDQHGH